ncbi:hypothetical protein [Cohnella silvisoli]|uniref:Uncharacterized protein n=1 Tax=Cohnella silvisoli TaxID=2873699 RepID=A0ABV1KLX6_9BACL|nr:hypothetical protein [Cohnella silvisoli]MCD9020567.1 hypothetical protein [Cohnella silvisoli]
MRLIGSKTELDIREELLKTKRAIYEDIRLLQLLEGRFPEMETAYILHWLLEQGEEFYKILVNDDVIVIIELDRHDINIDPLIEAKPVSQYKKGLSKIRQIKLAVAIDLAKADLENNV